MPRMDSRYVRGFTLVEMLVVIAIIGVLAALLVPVAAGTIRRAREAAIGLEISQLVTGIEAYKSTIGDYPPDFTPTPSVNANNASAWEARVAAHLRAGFNRNSIALTTWRTNLLPDGRDPEKLDAAEALVFWLAMLSTNSRNPFEGLDTGTGERHEFFDFDEARLTCALFPGSNTADWTDLDEDGWPEYVSKYTPETPYVYFDGRVVNGTYAYNGASYDSLSSAGVLRPFRSNTDIPTNDTRTNPKNASNQFISSNPTTWMGDGKFQIHHSGLDELFGVDVSTSPVTFKQFPDPNYNDDDTDDNLTSFSDGSRLADMVP